MNLVDTASKESRILFFVYETALPWLETYTGVRDTFEDSPYHRESSVLIHTQMVVQAAFSLIQKETSISDTEKLGIILAAVFHDAGKPEAEETVYSEERGEYRRYAGHEGVSVKYWLEFAYQYSSCMSNIVSGDVGRFISAVAYMIEKHLPYSIKNETKKRELLNSLHDFGMLNAFKILLKADQLGRISDNPEAKLSKVDQYLEEFDIECEKLINGRETPEPVAEMIVLIGLPGAGKSSYIESLTGYSVVSLDETRVNLFLEENVEIAKCPPCYKELYHMAFDWAKDKNIVEEYHKEVSALIKSRENIVLDNTNLSRKKRAHLIRMARQKGYLIKGVLFGTDIQTCIARRRSANVEDKHVPSSVIHSMYDRLQVPIPSEFHEIKVLLK